MVHKINISDQKPVILEGRKLRMRSFTKSSTIGNTTYLVSSEYSIDGKEDALMKLKRVILNDSDTVDVTRDQPCDIVNSHTSDCLAEQRKEPNK